MKLLFADSTTRGYGTEQHAAALAIATLRRGHAVRCVVRGGSSIEAILRQAQVPCVPVPPGPLSGLRVVLSTVALARRERPDWLVTGDGRLRQSLAAILRHKSPYSFVKCSWQHLSVRATISLYLS